MIRRIAALQPTSTPEAAARWRPWLLGILLLTATGVAALVDLPSVDAVRDRIGDLGWAAPAAFVAAYAAGTLAPLPKNVLTAAAGLLFGFTQALALVWLAAVLGAAIAFALSRHLGQTSFQNLGSARVARFDALVAERGLVVLLALRLVPVVPFTAINYLAGLTRMSWTSYLLGTALGIVPGTVAYVAVGAFGTDLGTWQSSLSLGALAVLSVAGFMALRRRDNGLGREDPPERS